MEGEKERKVERKEMKWKKIRRKKERKALKLKLKSGILI